MTDEEFAELLALGHERRGIEFKGPGPRSAAVLFAKVVRAMLGMANQQDGGMVIVGVDENAGVLTPSGISLTDLATWRYDDIAAGIASYADPLVAFDIEEREQDGRRFLVIRVHEFEDVPVICKKEFPAILRPGACYVRTRRKPETSEIPSQTEMRDLLDLAINKGLRKFISRAMAAGLLHSAVPAAPVSDSDAYRAQLGDLLT
jgi:predicted HTH transcriptional regulator